ncbi:MAG: hypothetical protein OXC07_09700 [Kistimonas sp.]|nr:hypothetical protein [Kistimonas sp.]
MNGIGLDTDSGMGSAGAATSVLGRAVNNVGTSFEEIMDGMARMAEKGSLTTGEALHMQAKFHHYTMYQEMVTRVASKSANAVNDVMKAQ